MYKMLRNCSIVEFDYRPKPTHFCYGEFLPIIILLYIIPFTLIMNIIKLLYNCSSYKKANYVMQLKFSKINHQLLSFSHFFLNTEINSNYHYTEFSFFIFFQSQKISKKTYNTYTKHEIYHMQLYIILVQGKSNHIRRAKVINYLLQQ